jgi:GH24 family phage-related lysozyme (muramidase)
MTREYLTDPRIRIRKLSKAVTHEQIAETLRYVESLLNPHLEFHANELAALVSFVLTTRKGSFARSNILLLINENKRIKAAHEMKKPQWCKVNGEIKNRRKQLRIAQAELFLRPVCIHGGKDGGQNIQQ